MSAVAAPVPATRPASTHLAGAAIRDITPPPVRADGRPTLLAGFWPARVVTGIHSPLTVRAVAIAEPGGLAVVLAVADLVGLPRSLVLAVRATIEDPAGAAPATAGQATGVHAVMAATHTHSGPDTLGFWGPDDETPGTDPGYLARVAEAFVAAATEALGTLRPVGLVLASVRVPGVARNARQPNVVDDELTVLRAVGEDGATVATFLDFACHPEVLDGDSTVMSADYAGDLCRRVEAGLGGRAVFAAGALGAMMTPDREMADVASLERMGAALSAAALEALERNGRTLESGVRAVRRSIAIPSENPVFEAALAAGLVEPRERTASGAIVSDVSLVEIGGPAGLRLATVPGELAPSLGIPLRRSLGPAHGAVVGLADDELGYILDRADHVFPDDPRDPGEHYEETMSVGREAGPVVTDAIASLLAIEAAGATPTGRMVP